jgi:hypothetical protein
MLTCLRKFCEKYWMLTCFDWILFIKEKVCSFFFFLCSKLTYDFELFFFLIFYLSLPFSRKMPIEWTKEQMEALIKERKDRNTDYHRTFGRSRVEFWKDISETINNLFRTRLTGEQCRSKFKSLTNDYYVSKNIST